MKLKRRICQSTMVLDKKISLTGFFFPGSSIQCVTQQTANVFWPQVGPRKCISTLLLIILADNFYFVALRVLIVFPGPSIQCVTRQTTNVQESVYSVSTLLLIILADDFCCDWGFNGFNCFFFQVLQYSVLLSRRQVCFGCRSVQECVYLLYCWSNSD